MTTCEATTHVLRCEREQGHPGMHRHGDERTPQGATVWTDNGQAFSDHLKAIKGSA